MRCDAVRERLPLRGRDDLPAGERQALENHLSTCADCAREAARTAGSIRLLRVAWAPEPADPDEEEVLDMIAAANPSGSAAPRWRRALAAAAALVVLASVVSYLATRPTTAGPRTFADGPDVAPAGEVVVDPPALLLPNPAFWNERTDRLVLAVDGERVEARTSFPIPGTDDRRTRLAPEDPLPAPGDRTYASVVLAADADAPWRATLERAFRQVVDGGIGLRTLYADLFLAGRAPDGSMGVLPLQIDVPDLGRILGANLTPADLGMSLFLEIRVTRVPDGGVRYRWGRLDATTGDPDPGLEGDVTIPASLVDAGSVGDLAPLRQFLLEEGETGSTPPWRSLVLLRADRQARYVDVLRAVECADGDPAVYFWPDPHPVVERWGLLPEPPPGTEGVLRAPGPRGPSYPLIVNVDRDGLARWRGRVIDPGAFAFPRQENGILVYADAGAPWPSCAGLFRRAPSLRPLLVAFAEEPDLDLPSYLVLDVTWQAGSPPEEIRVERDGDGALRLPFPPEEALGRRLRLSVPDDARAGEVLRLALTIRARGGHVTFE